MEETQNMRTLVANREQIIVKTSIAGVGMIGIIQALKA